MLHSDRYALRPQEHCDEFGAQLGHTASNLWHSQVLSVGRVAEEWAMARPAVARGYQLRADDADLCHLCQEVRQVLREQYPGSRSTIRRRR